MFLQAMRMMRRDWRAGELYFLLLALVVAVAALSSVGFFIDRLAAGLDRDANQLLGADLVINADQPVSEDWRAEARRRGLRLAETVSFPSMALAGEGDAARSRLTSIKAVSAGYPLRGQVRVADRAGGTDMAAHAIPAPGTVWVDPDVLAALGVAPGEQLQLGEMRFRIDKVIAIEPDRGSAFINFAPRVMLGLPDLAATHLVQDGSRVTYRLLVAGPPPQVKPFQQWVEAQIGAANMRGVRIESLESGRPEMRTTLDRAHQFLS
ncbi:MAG TPA: ABC transporter permease, partial [Burkholderiaceae bacterium]|nr:ABC transporter permease [Burkholderiaceae bacterium]